MENKRITLERNVKAKKPLENKERERYNKEKKNEK